VAFEEADLVLVGRARYIGRGPLDREMVVHGARVDGCLSLRDQLSPPHIGIPFRSVVDRDLCALGRAGVCGVLVCGREIDVFGYCTGAVDVVLVVLRLAFKVSEFQNSKSGNIYEVYKDEHDIACVCSGIAL
jgi:hypothetical protein